MQNSQSETPQYLLVEGEATASFPSSVISSHANTFVCLYSFYLLAVNITSQYRCLIADSKKTRKCTT